MDWTSNPFTAHPASVGESYGRHFAFAAGMGLRMVMGGLACMAHAVLPFFFTRTGSRAIVTLHARISAGARAPITRSLEAADARHRMT